MTCFGKSEYKIPFKKIIYILKEKSALSILLNKDAKQVGFISMQMICHNQRCSNYVGCGDGKFLSSIISGYPKKIVIEDISSSNISEAYQNLKNKAEDVEKHVCNSLIAEFGNFDLVLAIGIFDYYPNWKNFLKKLLLHSQECIIISLPRIDHLRNWVRFVWFLIHGIQLQMLDRSAIFASGRRCDRLLL